MAIISSPVCSMRLATSFNIIVRAREDPGLSSGSFGGSPFGPPCGLPLPDPRRPLPTLSISFRYAWLVRLEASFQCQPVPPRRDLKERGGAQPFQIEKRGLNRAQRPQAFNLKAEGHHDASRLAPCAQAAADIGAVKAAVLIARRADARAHRRGLTRDTARRPKRKTGLRIRKCPGWKIATGDPLNTGRQFTVGCKKLSYCHPSIGIGNKEAKR